jgi:hypothetical protein
MRWLLLLALLLLAGAPPFLPVSLADEEADEEDDAEDLPGADEAPAERPFCRAPDPQTQPGPDADLFVKAIRLQEKKRYVAARRAFWKLIDEHPDSPYVPEAIDRSSPNAFLGIAPMGPMGPQARRIDVALMGDGYRIDKQRVYDKHCDGQLDVLLRERLYEVYRPYFNFWQFNLCSEDKGVDEPDPPAPDEEMERRRSRRRKKRGPRRYSTALDCKAAGPQGQVMADPRRVWHYLQYLAEHDSLAICFAQMGRLGMGGMGIATTGPRGVVVHEFGHAFVGLLDEYANNPGEPRGVFGAPNASTNPDDPPWKHFLDAKYPGVGVYEGGATFKKGVWRPAPGCAMNSGGGSPYCPVCREAGILAIYERVSPIDRVWPEARVVELVGGGEVPEFGVLPMQPDGHALEVKWFLGAAPAVTETAPEEPAYDPEEDLEGLDPFERRLRRKRAAAAGRGGEAKRPALPTPIGFRPGMTRRARGTAHLPLPRGKEIRGARRRVKGEGRVHMAKVPVLEPGRHLLTVVVWDPARPKGERRPWVLRDPRGLLEDRWEWIIEVAPIAPAEAATDR